MALLQETEPAAYTLTLSTVRSGDEQKKRTWFEGKPASDVRPKCRVPDPVGFDPEVGGEECGVLEEDGSELVERLTLWVKAWNRLGEQLSAPLGVLQLELAAMSVAC